MSAKEIRMKETPDDINNEAVKKREKETDVTVDEADVLTEAEIDDTQDGHAEALEKAAAAEDRLLRLAAEFENYKARIEREKINLLKYAEENVLKELLPSLDNLDRAIEQGQNADDIQSLLEGIVMTRNGLLSTLEKFGLKPLACVGEPFDPNFHEALSMDSSDKVPQNHVLQEFQKGYMLKDRLIRPAKVIVSKGSAED
ncbi:MAG TPA: nucleotide exchange factor GrpE [Peptococcaceae bacterium]|nr:nucleotide exchange factor GrpE [Peptococcaceae bacterium]